MSFRILAVLAIAACTLMPLAGCSGDGAGTDGADEAPSSNTTSE